MSTSKGLVVGTSKEESIKDFVETTTTEVKTSSKVKNHIFDPEVSPKSLTNDFRKNMILLDIQSRILKEIPTSQNLSSILEIDSVKDTFKLIGDTILEALKCNDKTELNALMRVIISLSQSIIKLFANTVSEGFNDYIYEYLYEISKNIIEVNSIK